MVEAFFVMRQTSSRYGRPRHEPVVFATHVDVRALDVTLTLDGQRALAIWQSRDE